MKANRITLSLCLGVLLSACGGARPATPDTTGETQALLDAAPVPLPQAARFNLRCHEFGGRDFGIMVVRPGGSLDSAPDSPFAAPLPAPGVYSGPPFRGQTFAIYARNGAGLPAEIFAGKHALLFGEGRLGGIYRYALDRDSAAPMLIELFANKIVVFRAYITDAQLGYLNDRLEVGRSRARDAALGPAGYFIGEQQRLQTAFQWAFAQNRATGILSDDQVSAYQCAPDSVARHRSP